MTTQATQPSLFSAESQAKLQAMLNPEAAPAPTKDGFVPSKKWLNFGINVPVPQADGSVVEQYVELGGIPLDDIKEPKLGQNAEWNTQQTLRYIALTQLANLVTTPGTTSDKFPAFVQTRLAGGDKPVSLSPEALAAAVGNLFKA